MATQAIPAPTNLNFEEGTIGDIPASWASPTQRNGYTVRLTDEAPKRGQLCVEIAKSEDGESRDVSFGNVMQMIDATSFRGKRLRFTGWARTRSAITDWLKLSSSKAQAWLRVDRSLGTIGFFDNMQDRPIRSSRWHHFEIVGDIANDAEYINLGLILQGNGKAWLDDVQIEVLGDGGIGNQPPAVLTQRHLDNIIALTRLIGYVRFFHPTDAAAETNWDLFTINAIRHVENARSPKELALLLNQVFNPVAPTVQIGVSGSDFALSKSSDDLESNASVRYWEHRGVRVGDSRSIYSSKRLTSSNAPVSLHEPIRDDLGGGVIALVPTAIPMKDAVSYEGVAFKKLVIDNLPDDWKPSADDRSTRLAAVISTWNVFQHFYPYFDVVEIDWYKELARALVSSATDDNASAFSHSLEQLIAALQDGHGRVFPMSRFVPPPVAFDWVDDSIVVTAIGKDVDERLHIGDVVIEIDGESIEPIVASLHGRISAATPGYLRNRILSQLGYGANRSSFTLKTRSPDGELKEISLKREASSNFPQPLRESRPDQGSELAEGVVYVDLDRVNRQHEFTKLIPKLATAKGILFDLRGYPSFRFTRVISHLIDETVTSAQWHIPLVHHPDQHHTKYTFSNWKVRPRSPRFTKNIAFVTDGQAISAAETLMGIVEHYKLAEIVGQPTAGTNGNVNPFTVPGGFTIVWTGMRVLKHDGSQHHGVGIQPTIPVSRTIEGIAAGRDEFLEKAVATLVQKIEPN